MKIPAIEFGTGDRTLAVGSTFLLVCKPNKVLWSVYPLAYEEANVLADLRV